MTKIVPAYPDLDLLDGVKYEVGKPVDVDPALARQLIADGTAQAASASTPKKENG